MTRLDSFKKWLEENGAAPKDCEFVDDISDRDLRGNDHGCWGFYCPANIPLGGDDLSTICEKCPYYEFWFKEV